MPANFSVLYHSCSPKTISAFYNKSYNNYFAHLSDNMLMRQKAPAGKFRQGL